MKPISREVLASTSTEGMGELISHIDEKIAYLIVNKKANTDERAFAEPNGDLCSFCRREKGERDLILAGHTVSICPECFASHNNV